MVMLCIQIFQTNLSKHQQHFYVYTSFLLLLLQQYKTKHIKVHVFVYLHITITYILMRGNAFYFQFAKQPRHVDRMGIFGVEGESMCRILRFKYQMLW